MAYHKMYIKVKGGGGRRKLFVCFAYACFSKHTRHLRCFEVSVKNLLREVVVLYLA